MYKSILPAALPYETWTPYIWVEESIGIVVQAVAPVPTVRDQPPSQVLAVEDVPNRA